MTRSQPPSSVSSSMTPSATVTARPAAPTDRSDRRGGDGGHRLRPVRGVAPLIGLRRPRHGGRPGFVDRRSSWPRPSWPRPSWPRPSWPGLLGRTFLAEDFLAVRPSWSWPSLAGAFLAAAFFAAGLLGRRLLRRRLLGRCRLRPSSPPILAAGRPDRAPRAERRRPSPAPWSASGLDFLAEGLVVGLPRPFGPRSRPTPGWRFAAPPALSESPPPG